MTGSPGRRPHHPGSGHPVAHSRHHRGQGVCVCQHAFLLIITQVLGMLKEVSPQLTAPVVVFSYYNPLLRRGFDTFCKQVKDAGASGMPQCNDSLHTYK